MCADTSIYNFGTFLFTEEKNKQLGRSLRLSIKSKLIATRVFCER